jgi:thymidylate synthase
MNHLETGTLGEAWLQLVEKTLASGTRMGEEGRELLGIQVSFPAINDEDPLLARFGDGEMMKQMEKVFFQDGPNSLGHNYVNLMRGPGNRHDLEDVVALLRNEPETKRAVVTLCGPGTGAVPCLNVIQFLVREGALKTFYFARGQDAFRKFYADALCVGKMARKVAAALRIPAGGVTGFIGSCHVYDRDREAIQDMLKRAKTQLGEVSTGGRV